MVSADEQAWRDQLLELHQHRQVVSLSAEARERLEAVMPLLLEEIAQQSCELIGLQRVIAVIMSVLKRSSYLVLLKESATARAHLVKLCIASPWLTDYLVKMPSLLDQLLDERQLYSPLSQEALKNSLQAQLPEEQDDEQFMNVIRRFKHAQVFRVAASDLTGVLPLMKVSDYLTWIAETILQATLVYAWQLITARHGYPKGYQADQPIPFMIVGFGKLGGLELGYASDLDMVYLSDERFAPDELTEGNRPLEHQLFFTRLAQKMNSLLSTQTLLGSAYEVDMQVHLVIWFLPWQDFSVMSVSKHGHGNIKR
jgi:glutamate-ammonia-ligase adenylyltransferase